jgi:segregation and condensation protein B
MSDESERGYSDEEVNLIEAILFSSPRPMAHSDLKKVLKRRHKGGIRSIVEQLNRKYAEHNHSFRIREIAEGFQFHLIEPYSLEVERHFSRHRKRRLSQAGLETLAIIAYKQPVTRGEIEQIRGVSSDGVMQTLLERSLIKPAGRADRIGRPLMYATTRDFLEYFGLASLEQLPKLEEIMPRRRQQADQQRLAFEFDEPSTDEQADDSPEAD